jgi:hypothetical protein
MSAYISFSSSEEYTLALAVEFLLGKCGKRYGSLSASFSSLHPIPLSFLSVLWSSLVLSLFLFLMIIQLSLSPFPVFLYSLLSHPFSAHSGPVVKNLSSSRASDEIAKKYDCAIHTAPVGEINVSREGRGTREREKRKTERGYENQKGRRHIEEN